MLILTSGQTPKAPQPYSGLCTCHLGRLQRKNYLHERNPVFPSQDNECHLNDKIHETGKGSCTGPAPVEDTNLI